VAKIDNGAGGEPSDIDGRAPRVRESEDKRINHPLIISRLRCMLTSIWLGVFPRCSLLGLPSRSLRGGWSNVSHHFRKLLKSYFFLLTFCDPCDLRQRATQNCDRQDSEIHLESATARDRSPVSQWVCQDHPHRHNECARQLTLLRDRATKNFRRQIRTRDQ